jgi:hypothetical protein
MKAATGAALCIAWLLASAAAMADTFYRYRDKAAGRDVFVNRLEQVPRQYRRQAKVVFESGGLANQDDLIQQAPKAPSDDGLADKLIKDLVPKTARSASDAATRYASAGKGFLNRGPAAAAEAVDAKLSKAGAMPLGDEERAQLARLLMTTIWAGAAAGLWAFVVWVILIAHAFRDKRPGWGALMIVLSPLAYVYLILHFGKGRPFLKTACALGLLSPGLVALWGAWQFYSWFHIVAQVRGGHL